MTPNTSSASSGAQPTDDLFTVTLVDGLKATTDKGAILYKTVRLREPTVGDERVAYRMAERPVFVGGVHQLLCSDADFRYAMTLMHIEFFQCDGQTIPRGVLDLGILDKLSPHDLALIEQRVLLIGLAAEVRYGTLTEADFAALMRGDPVKRGTGSPQPQGQAAGVGSDDLAAESGPIVLADFAGADAPGAVARHGR